MYTLRLLGGFALQASDGGRAVSLAQRRAEALLALLAVAGDLGCTRDRLVGLLWPERDGPHARHSLRDVIYAARSVLGRRSVAGTGDVLRLDFTHVTCDVRRFSDALAYGRLEEAVAVYSGPLLDGFHLGDAPDFERWVDDERARLSRACLDAAQRLAEGAERDGAWSRAAEWWSHAVTLDPYDTRMVLRRIGALARWGDRANALKEGAKHLELLSSELELQPDPSFLEELRRIRDEASAPAPQPAMLGGRAEASPELTAPPPSASVQPTDDPSNGESKAVAEQRGTLRRRSRLRSGSAVVVTAGVVLAALGVWWQRHGKARQSTPTLSGGESTERLVVIPLTNLTADPDGDVWGKLAANWIARTIDDFRPVDVIPTTVVLDALRTLGDTASVASVAAYTDATYAFAGTVARTGTQVRFDVELLDVRTGERLSTLDPVLGPADSVEAVVGRLAERAAAVAVQHLDPSTPPWSPIGSTPPSVAVFREHLEQIELFCRSRYAESIEVGNRILAMAPDFHPALAANRTSYANLGLYAKFDSMTPVLEGFRDQMTRMEQALFDWLNGNVYGDPALATFAADEAYRLDAKVTGGYPAGFTYIRTNRVSEAVDRFFHADVDGHCAREWVPWWKETATAYHLLGRYQEELALARRGLGRFPNDRRLMDREAAALAGLGRPDAVDSLLDVMAILPPQQGYDPGLRPMFAGLELRAHGHPEAARAAFDRALRWFAGLPAASSRYNRARALYSAGLLAEADTIFRTLLDDEPENLNYVIYHGKTLARLGRRDEALEVSWLLGSLDGPGVHGRHVGAQACIAAALGDKEDAVRLLQEAFRKGHWYGTWIHTEPAVDGMWGYGPWEALVAVR